MECFCVKLYSLVGEGDGTPLQYSCLENPMDRGAWKAAVHGVVKGRTRLSNFTFTFQLNMKSYLSNTRESNPSAVPFTASQGFI